MTKSKHIRGNRKIWTESEDKFLKNHYHDGAKVCACYLNTTVYSVHSRAYKLGIPGITYKKFSDEHRQFIKENYCEMSNKEIGELLGRSNWSIKELARRLGLKRSLEESQRIQDRCCKKAYFTKGHQPKNTKSDFEITIRTSHCGSNYKWIRLSVANWAMLHVYNWEKVNGPVPKDKILRSISEDRLDCSPENWKLVDRAEHLDLNSGRSRLEDKYISNVLSWRNRKLRDTYIQVPELIELKRNELKLRRAINEFTETSKTN